MKAFWIILIVIILIAITYWLYKRSKMITSPVMTITPKGDVVVKHLGGITYLPTVRAVNDISLLSRSSNGYWVAVNGPSKN